MSNHCVVCDKTVRRDQLAVSCDQCESWTHRVCGTGLSVSRYREICRNEEDFPFVCVRCRMDVEDEVRAPDISDITISAASLPPPDQEVERSTTDCIILDPPTVDIPENVFTIVETGSQKGKKKLVDSYGFTYVVRRSTAARTYWRCSVRNKTTTCPATVIQLGASFEAGKHRHCHPPQPGQLTAIRVRVEVKEKAVNNICKSGASIVEEAQQSHINPDKPGGRQNQATLIRMANRTRELLRRRQELGLQV